MLTDGVGTARCDQPLRALLAAAPMTSCSYPSSSNKDLWPFQGPDAAHTWSPSIITGIQKWTRLCRDKSGVASHVSFSRVQTLECTLFFQSTANTWASTLYVILRATSHTRLKAHDHFNLRALIGRKGGDRPSSLHSWRWRPKDPKKTSWMKSLHEVLHAGLWIRFHGMPELTSGLPPRGGPDANFGRPWFFNVFKYFVNI